MANVLFTRTSDPNSKPITDGQLIFDTSGNGKMYLDNGTERLEMGGALTVDATLSKTSTNPIQNKAVAGVMLDNLSDINNVTSKGFLADALAIKELNSSLTRIVKPVGNATLEIYGKLCILQYNNVAYNNTDNVPEEYRPKINTPWASVSSDEDYTANYRIAVDPNGNVGIQKNGGNVSSLENVRCQICWII